MTEQEVLVKEQEIIRKEHELARKEKLEEIRDKRKKKKLISFLIWTGVVILVIFITLFLSSRIAQFESIAAMIRYIQSQPIQGLN